MFEDIKNKRVLITGSSGGMGTSMAKLFAEYGARLGLHYLNNKPQALQLAEEIKKKSHLSQAQVFQADLLDVNACKNLIKSFIETFGGIDVLINNAGAVHCYTHFSELEESDWEKTFHLNVKAPFYLIGAAFLEMKKQGGGRIINMSSVNVKYGGSAKSIHYVSSKAALDTMTLGFAREGAAHNILVNSIRCGFIDTPMRTKIPGYSEENFKKRVSLIPLKRMGETKDIDRMALFLASECGNFITGEIFTVAGGD